MSELPPVAEYLTQRSVPFSLFRHTGQVHSLEQAAQERGHLPEQVIRSILFRTGENNYTMVLMAGPAQISWPALRTYLGQSRLSLASEDQVLEVTGYRVGAVSPLAMLQPVRILADDNVFLPDEISIGSGERGAAVIMNSSDLRRMLENVEIGNFRETH